MTSVRNQHPHPSREGPASDELRWGHPLLRFARFLGGAGFWLSHGLVVAGVVALLLTAWLDLQVSEVLIVLTIMVSGIAWLFAFAGWLARRSLGRGGDK